MTAPAKFAALADASTGVAAGQRGTLPCCGGYQEHFEACEVGAAITAARWSIARSQAVRP